MTEAPKEPDESRQSSNVVWAPEPGSRTGGACCLLKRR